MYSHGKDEFCFGRYAGAMHDARRCYDCKDHGECRAKTAGSQTRMEFKIERSCHDEVITFRGTVPMRELASLEFNKLDKALLDDVGGDSKASAADYLLVLEMIYRRNAEQKG